jgi:uncharacterized protein
MNILPEARLEEILNPKDREKPDHVYVSWQTVLRDCVTLTKLVNNDFAKKGKNINGLVSLPRGGWFPAMVMSRIARIEATSLVGFSLTSYPDGATESKGSHDIGQVPAEKDVYGKRLLVPDDVFESGRTIDTVRNELLVLGAEEVVVATPYDKPTKHKVPYGPDYVVKSYPDAPWIHFPWEGLEDLFEAYGSQIFSAVGMLATQENVEVRDSIPLRLPL